MDRLSGVAQTAVQSLNFRLAFHAQHVMGKTSFAFVAASHYIEEP